MTSIRISGELNADSVPARLRESTRWFEPGATVAVDLADVTRADSAGVALLLDWLRQARAAQAELTFRNPPAQMLAIIDFCALGEIIPLLDTAGCV